MRRWQERRPLQRTGTENKNEKKKWKGKCKERIKYVVRDGGWRHVELLQEINEAKREIRMT